MINKQKKKQEKQGYCIFIWLIKYKQKAYLGQRKVE